MAIWGVGILFSELSYVRAFLKNHAISKVFPTHWRPDHMPFLIFFFKIWCPAGELGYNLQRQPQAFKNLRGDSRLNLHVLWQVLNVLWLLHVLYPSLSWPSPYHTLRCPAKHLHEEREAQVYGWDGMGWIGWDGTGYQKCYSIIFILCGY